jgi:hypothetical protein
LTRLFLNLYTAHSDVGGTGTNPTGSAEWCAGSAYHSGMPSDTRDATSEEEKSKVRSKSLMRHSESRL